MTGWPLPAAAFFSHKSFGPYKSALGMEPHPEFNRTQWKAQVVSQAFFTEQIFDALKGSNLAFCVVKGLALAHQVYPDPFSRTYSDLDLFVRPAHFGKAAERLLALGYGFAPYVVKQTKHYQLVQPNWPTVDLHHGLSRDFHDPPRLLTLLTSDLMEVPFGGSSFFVPTPPLHALYVLLHARNHSFLHKPSWALDLALIERAFPGALHGAQEHAQRLGLHDATTLGLGLLSHLLEPPLPPPVPKITLSYRQRVLANVVIRSLKSGRSPYLPSLFLRGVLKNSLYDNMLWISERF